MAKRAAVKAKSSKKALGAPSQPEFPRSGDILASRPTARADVYAISVVPAKPKMVPMRYNDAVKRVREIARERAVDGWYTGDHTHFLKVARYRNLTGRQ
jgi:hypothetical protein